MSIAGSLVVLAFAAATEPAATDQLYLALAGASNITAYDIDAANNGLLRRSVTPLPGRPGALALSPDGSFLYAAVTDLRRGGSGVSTLKRAKDGSLSLIATIATLGHATHLRTDPTGRYLLLAYYHRGGVAVHRIEDGVVGRPVYRSRTERSAHAIGIDQSGRFVFVPHPESNRIYQFALDPHTGRLVPGEPPFVEGPDEARMRGPRAYARHPILDMAYTANESAGGISAWKLDPNRGSLELVQTSSTLPQGFVGKSAAAHIGVTPDGRFAYVSNRDLRMPGAGKPPRDSIAGFALDPATGSMQPIGFFPTARIPRSFCFGARGRLLFVAGFESGELFVHEIDPTTGRLHHVATHRTQKNATTVICVDRPASRPPEASEEHPQAS
ncbi:MAG: beta-propeller fold lactonase family protein [Gemmatimonadota bacterium]|nr:beta-propeller fold lactonase family protein [Gemmatimonadota bacterium]